VAALAVLPALALAARGSVIPGARWWSDHAMPPTGLTWPILAYCQGLPA